MRIRLLRLLTLGLTTLFLRTAKAQAVDPSFQPTELYSTANAITALSQPDGKRLLLGAFLRAQTRKMVRLMRFNPDNTVDEAFVDNTATLSGSINNVRLLPTGKLLIIGNGPLTIGGVTRQDILLLHADGTVDTSFDAGVASGAGLARVSAVQPDGRILLGGTFTNYNGVAARRIVRLLPTGAVDPAFNAGTQFDDTVEEITLQPDGKILVGGRFNSPASVARLLPNGTLDPTFTSPLTTSARISMIGVQADGKVLLGSSDFSMPFTDGTYSEVARLLPNGTKDPSFEFSLYLDGSSMNNTGDANEFVVQANGQIILPMQGKYFGSSTNSLIRLNSNGSRDFNFSLGLSGISSLGTVLSLQREPSGKLLIAGTHFRLNGRRNNVAVLNADGTIDATFNPVLLTFGEINTTALLPDGKILIGGRFEEVNGVRANSLMRLNADGSVDASFPTQSANGFIPLQITLQPDGKILLSGTEQLRDITIPNLIRLLPSGALDNTFQIVPNTTVSLFALQPDGSIVISDRMNVSRLLADGRPDNTFVSGYTDGPGFIYGMLAQSDGKILVGGGWDTYNAKPLHALVRLLPTGALDPSFSSPIQTVPEAEVDEFLVQPDGKIVVCGLADATNPATMAYVLFRMLPNGATDNTFNATLPAYNGYAFARDIALQPNGRILAVTYGGQVVRVLANGQPDASFTPVVLSSDAEDVLVQPDGKILLGGYFSTVNGQATTGLARLTAPNVLHVRNSHLDARTQAWPVPAHGTLNLSLDASAQPRSVELLDNLGRMVLAQPVAQAELRLPLRQVKAGVYLLRVNYASGPITRRVVVE